MDIFLMRHGHKLGKNLSDLGKVQAKEIAEDISKILPEGNYPALHTEYSRTAQYLDIIVDTLGYNGIKANEDRSLTHQVFPDEREDQIEYSRGQLEKFIKYEKQGAILVVAHNPNVPAIGYQYAVDNGIEIDRNLKPISGNFYIDDGAMVHMNTVEKTIRVVIPSQT